MRACVRVCVCSVHRKICHKLNVQNSVSSVPSQQIQQKHLHCVDCETSDMYMMIVEILSMLQCQGTDIPFIRSDLVDKVMDMISY